jgi:NAD(P)-dependent dehydrogenase (short-subunit alcohol dehydrogenase family)/endonuclease/exonuclease/phosphatase (EEP) superfamily protein YafD
VAHLLLNGRWWGWLLASLAPPPVFVAVPALLAVLGLLAGGAAGLAAAAVSAAALAVGARQSGLVPGALLGGRADAAPEGAIRVVVWNTQHWCQHVDPDRFHAFLRELDADVYLLQEYHNDLFDGTYRLIDDEERLRASFPEHEIVTARGLATLSRLPVDKVVETAARRTLRVDLRLPDGEVFATFNVHIPVQLLLTSPLRAEFYRVVRQRAGQREKEYEGLAADVAACDRPALIAGDFNTSPAIGDARRIARLGTDAARSAGRVYPTSWQARPGMRWWRLDWALTTPGLRVHSYRFRDPRGLSDHSVQEVTVTSAGTVPGAGNLSEPALRQPVERFHDASSSVRIDRPGSESTVPAPAGGPYDVGSESGEPAGNGEGEMPVLKGKTAVVTGGSRGIGRAIVERLARDGAMVVFNYARSAEAAAEVVRAVEEAGGSAQGVQLDLAQPGAAERLMETAAEQLGGLDILVNNAAASFAPAPLAETDEELFDRVLAVNTKSTFLTMRYAARHLRDGGRIVNISSLNTIRPAPGNAPYAASKGAIEQLTRVASRELGPRGITVNTVSPGATDTDLLREANPGGDFQRVIDITPLGRLGLPSDIAGIVAFLAGPDGRWLTGQNLHADGGLS